MEISIGESVSVDYRKKRSNRELLIEFTGKILEDAYPELISSTNIRQCFENINKLGICQLNISVAVCITVYHFFVEELKVYHYSFKAVFFH